MRLRYFDEGICSFSRICSVLVVSYLDDGSVGNDSGGSVADSGGSVADMGGSVADVRGSVAHGGSSVAGVSQGASVR